MAFLDDLFGRSKYLNKDRQPEQRSARKDALSAAPKPMEISVTHRPATGNDPDSPVPFGYKCNWLCVKSDKPMDVIEKLGLKNAEPSNWDKGIEMAYNGYRFVSPALDGYVLVVNIGMDMLTVACRIITRGQST